MTTAVSTGRPAPQPVLVPPMPDRLSGTEVVKRYHRLQDLTKSDLGKTYQAVEFMLFVNRIHAALPGVSLSALQTTLSHLAGVPITSELLNQVLKLISGSLTELKAGVPVTDTTWRRWSGWSAALIIDLVMPDERAKKNKKKPDRAVLVARVQSGPATGMTVTANFRTRGVFHFAKILGFQRAKFNQPIVRHTMRHPRDIVGLSAALYLTNVDSREAPRIVKLHTTSAMRVSNHKRIAKRYGENFSCPRGIRMIPLPCVTCYFGVYGPEFQTCENACRMQTQTRTLCRCGATICSDHGQPVIELCPKCSATQHTEVPGRGRASDRK